MVQPKLKKREDEADRTLKEISQRIMHEVGDAAKLLLKPVPITRTNLDEYVGKLRPSRVATMEEKITPEALQAVYELVTVLDDAAKRGVKNLKWMV
ncbi:hypothetical protein HYT84_01085 [Candidatus Micrarchaeota archaeon]|nr:hypothetical protein [Candidatus Micrarchaeota archaeon]